MKITILNGNPGSQNAAFDRICIDLTRELEKHDHCVTLLDLKTLTIKPCTGCFGCWVKTPGKCVLDDDIGEVLENYINSRLVLFASPLIMGFPSALFRSVQEKFTPLGIPYMTIIDKEMHHFSRYKTLPRIGVLYEKEDNTDDEDLAILEENYHRTAINVHGKLLVFRDIKTNIRDLVNEINNI
ncbi:MAG: flavodoxin family protein [bacterium]|nr:flavodoxin family protein [bacterium]